MIFAGKKKNRRLNGPYNPGRNLAGPVRNFAPGSGKAYGYKNGLGPAGSGGRNSSIKSKSGRKLRHLFRALPALLAVIVLAAVFRQAGGWQAGLDMLSGLDYFRLAEVKISGCNFTNRSEIRRTLGVDHKTSLFDIDADDLAEKIKEKSWVYSARVKKRWPDALLVSIEEHTPEALIVFGEQDHTRMYYLSASGQPFAEAGEDDDLDLPVITGIKSAAELEASHEVKKALLTLLKQVRRNSPYLPRQNVSELHVIDKQRLVMYLVDYPFPIYLGIDRIKGQYKNLLTLLGVLYKKHGKGVKIDDVGSICMNCYERRVSVLLAR